MSTLLPDLICIEASTIRRIRVLLLVEVHQRDSRFGSSVNFSVVENPLESLGGYRWASAEAGEPEEVLFRPGFGWNGCKKVWLTRQGKILERGSYEQIHVYHSSAMSELFGNPWTAVLREEDYEKQWHFWPEDLGPAPAPAAPAPPASAPVDPDPAPPVVPAPAPAPASASRIPPHVFRSFVEAAVSKGDECPITMSPLTLSSAAAPPCGHLFDREALKKALEAAGRCPTCRGAARPEEIQAV